MQGLFEVAVALFDDPLVFVDLEHSRAAAGVGRVGQVGGQGIQPVEGGCGGQRARVGAPGDGGGAVAGGAGGDGDQLGEVGPEDLGDPVIDVLLKVAERRPPQPLRMRVSAAWALARARWRAWATERPPRRTRCRRCEPMGGAGVEVIDVAMTEQPSRWCVVGG